MIVGNAPTMTRMWRGACRKLFFMEPPQVQKGSSMTMTFGNMVSCDSMEFDLDVWLDLHLTKSRFPVLQRTYLNLEEYEDFMVRAGNVIRQRGAVTRLNATPHKPRGINRTKKTGNYAHGGCIHGWDFRVDRVTKKPELSMHSRVSYLPYMGGLDLALSYHLAKELGAQHGWTPEDFSFRWYCTSFQFAHMQSIAYVQNNEEMLEAIAKPKVFHDDKFPTVKLMRQTLNSFRQKMEDGMAPEDEKFAQLMRYRKRWESRVNGVGPWSSIPVQDLSLDALRSTRPVVDEEED